MIHAIIDYCQQIGGVTIPPTYLRDKVQFRALAHTVRTNVPGTLREFGEIVREFAWSRVAMLPAPPLY